jgi:hypothetical protein
LAAVHAAAAVPPNWRGRFFAAVADLLTLTPDPSNRDVIEAVSAARRAMALGSTAPAAEKPLNAHARRAPYRRRSASGAA